MYSLLPPGEELLRRRFSIFILFSVFISLPCHDKSPERDPPDVLAFDRQVVLELDDMTQSIMMPAEGAAVAFLSPRRGMSRARYEGDSRVHISDHEEETGQLQTSIVLLCTEGSVVRARNPWGWAAAPTAASGSPRLLVGSTGSFPHRASANPCGRLLFMAWHGISWIMDPTSSQPALIMISSQTMGGWRLNHNWECRPARVPLG